MVKSSKHITEQKKQGTKCCKINNFHFYSQIISWLFSENKVCIVNLEVSFVDQLGKLSRDLWVIWFLGLILYCKNFYVVLF